MEGPDQLYRFSGYFEYKVWLYGVTTISGSRIGKQIISFKDGVLISIMDPTIEISNILTERIHNLNDKLVIIDHINKLVSTVTYYP